MSKTFSYFDEDQCIECGAPNFRESNISGVCVDCNPSGGTDDRKHKNEIITKNNLNKHDEEDD